MHASAPVSGTSGLWSDDEDGDDDIPVAIALSDAAVRSEIMSKFHVQFRNYRKYCKTINWEKECPDLELGKKTDEDGNKVPINVVRDLWKAKMGPVLRGITDLDQDMGRFGLLPYMATTCEGSIGACLASSFCERVNSIAKAVMTLDRTLLDGEEMDMLTVLRASKDFIEFMPTNFACARFRAGVLPNSGGPV